MESIILNAGLTVNRHRPHDKLPYRGAWLDIGPEMIHLMELPNPDKFGERPEHGGRDRHFCMGLEPGAVNQLMAKLDQHGMPAARIILLSLHCMCRWQTVSSLQLGACDAISFIGHPHSPDMPAAETGPDPGNGKKPERMPHAGIKYTKSKSGRPAIFFRDPDQNCLEAVELDGWR
jgi:hypothetical protein